MAKIINEINPSIVNTGIIPLSQDPWWIVAYDNTFYMYEQYALYFSFAQMWSYMFGGRVYVEVRTYCDNSTCADNPTNLVSSQGMRVARFTKEITPSALKHGGDFVYYFEDGGGSTWDVAIEFKFDGNYVEIWAYTLYIHTDWNGIGIMEASALGGYTLLTSGYNTMIPNPYYEKALISKYAIPPNQISGLHVIDISSYLINQ